MLYLYHRTTRQRALQILQERRMVSRENNRRAYFSDRADGHATGYGQGVVMIAVPAELAELEDEFPDGELHYTIAVDDLRPEHFITG